MYYTNQLTYLTVHIVAAAVVAVAALVAAVSQGNSFTI